MPSYKSCSVADVTLRVKADLQQSAYALGAAVWYWGQWMESSTGYMVGTYMPGAMLFEVLPEHDPPGLYYTRPYYNYIWWHPPGYSLPVPFVRNKERRALAVPFNGNLLDVTLRFTTEDGETDATITAYANGNVVDQITANKHLAQRQLPEEDYRVDPVTWLYSYFELNRGVPAGAETAHMGNIVATVYETFLDSLHDGREMLKKVGGAPVVQEVVHDWTDFYAFFTTPPLPAQNSDEYRVGGDLIYSGDIPFYWGFDEEGMIYAKPGALAMLYSWWRAFVTPGGANLALTHDPVSNALLVTDAGLATGGSVGHHKIMRGGDGYVWSPRYPVVES